MAVLYSSEWPLFYKLLLFSDIFIFSVNGTTLGQLIHPQFEHKATKPETFSTIHHAGSFLYLALQSVVKKTTANSEIYY